MRSAIEVQDPISTSERMKYWGSFFDVALYFDIKPHKDNTFNPELAIHSSDKSTLESLTAVFPGNINPRFKDPGGEDYQEWVLRINSAPTSFRFLQWIKPHLEYTQPQAEVFEKFVLQKREVRRILERVSPVPQLYLTPQDRITVEKEAWENLHQAKTQTVYAPNLPQQPRLAGIFDAASYGGISFRQAEPFAYSDYQVSVGLHSVHQGLLLSLYHRYGGTEPAERTKGIRRYAGPTFAWSLSGEGILELLQDIAPYLIFKRTEAGLILDFLKIRATFAQNPTDDPTVQSQRCSVLQSYVENWQQLKHPGVGAVCKI